MSRKEELLKIIDDAIRELNELDDKFKYRLHVFEAIKANVQNDTHTYSHAGELFNKVAKINKMDISELKALYDQEDDQAYEVLVEAIDIVYAAVEIFWTNKAGDVNANGRIVLGLLDELYIVSRHLPASLKHECAIWLLRYKEYTVQELISGIREWTRVSNMYKQRFEREENSDRMRGMGTYGEYDL